MLSPACSQQHAHPQSGPWHRSAVPPPRRQVVTAVKLARATKARIARRRRPLKPAKHQQGSLSVSGLSFALQWSIVGAGSTRRAAAQPPAAAPDAAPAASNLSLAAVSLPCLQHLHAASSTVAPVLPPWVPVPWWRLIPPASIAAAAAVLVAVWLSAARRPKPAMVLLLLTLVPPLLSRRRQLAAAVPAVIGRRRRPSPIVPTILTAIPLPARAAGWVAAKVAAAPVVRP